MITLKLPDGITEAHWQRYGKLLKADYSHATLRSVLALLWRVIAPSTDVTASAWQSVLVYAPKADWHKEPDQHILATLRKATEALQDPRIPELPSVGSHGCAGRELAVAQQAWSYLCVQLLARLTGATAFFEELQSLLFLNSIHELLPELKNNGCLREHDILVNALFVHTVVVWRDDPAHEYYLQSVLMDYLEDHEAALELRLRSLRLTDTEDHSYLTKAQAYWSDLLDFGKREEAYSFLLQLYRSAPDSYLPEIREMLKATVELGALSKVVPDRATHKPKRIEGIRT